MMMMIENLSSKDNDNDLYTIDESLSTVETIMLIITTENSIYCSTLISSISRIAEGMAKEKLTKEKLTKEKLTKEKLTKEKLTKEKLAKEKLAKEKLAKENLSKICKICPNKK